MPMSYDSGATEVRFEGRSIPGRYGWFLPRSDDAMVRERSDEQRKAHRLARLTIERFPAARKETLRDIWSGEGRGSTRDLLPWLRQSHEIARRAAALVKILDAPRDSTEPPGTPPDGPSRSDRLRLILWAVSLFDQLRAGALEEIGKRVWQMTLHQAFAFGTANGSRHANAEGLRAAALAMAEPSGILVLARELGTPYVDLFFHARSKGLDLRGVECEALGFDHSDVMRCVLRHLDIAAVSIDPPIERRAESEPRDRAPRVGMPVSVPRSAVLTDSIARAGDACRKKRQALSLILVAWDDASAPVELDMRAWKAWVDDLSKSLSVRCEGLLHPVCLDQGPIAIVLSNCDRTTALGIARRLKEDFAGWAAPIGLDEPSERTCSLGVATHAMPPRNFVPGDLLLAAQRCLSAAGMAGGGMIKSIDLL